MLSSAMTALTRSQWTVSFRVRVSYDVALFRATLMISSDNSVDYFYYTKSTFKQGLVWIGWAIGLQCRKSSMS